MSPVPLIICSGKHEEQWRRVYAAVVLAERHFSQLRHFAVPKLTSEFFPVRRLGRIKVRRLR